MLKRILFAGMLSISAIAIACGGDDDPQSSGDEATKTESSPTAAATATVAGSNAAARNIAGVEIPRDLVNGQAAGAATAKVTLTVFEDFQCPHCLNYTQGVEPMIINEYVKTGKVKIEFKNLPILGTESALAAVAAHCAGVENRFWEFHKVLFFTQAEANQLTDEKVNVGRFSAENLAKYAAQAGADPAKFAACATSPEAIDAVTASVKEAQGIGFRGTPSFQLNGKALSGQPSNLAGWRKLLDDAITAAK